MRNKMSARELIRIILSENKFLTGFELEDIIKSKRYDNERIYTEGTISKRCRENRVIKDNEGKVLKEGWFENRERQGTTFVEWFIADKEEYPVQAISFEQTGQGVLI